MSRLRAWLFALVFYGGSVPIVLTVPISALFGQAPLTAHVRGWARYHRWAARAVLGITSRLEGRPPPGAILYAAKHEAMFETIEMVLLLDTPMIVMKEELARIPLWGWAAQRYGMIVIDRAASAAAVRQLVREGAKAREQGRPILIFPEGTRVARGETPPLKAGFAGMYRLLGLPVVAVALDSGVAFPKGGTPRAGEITFRFGEVIAPGLPRDQVEARVHAEINALS